MTDEPLPPPLPDDPPAVRPVDDYESVVPVDDYPLPPPTGVPPRLILFWGILAFGAAAFVGLFVGGGLLPQPAATYANLFAVAGLESLPFLLLALLAYPGERYVEMRFLTVAYWLVLVGGICLMSVAVSFAGLIDAKVLMELQAGGPNTRPPDQWLAPPQWSQLGVIGLGTVAAMLLGLVAYLPPVRRLAAKVLPLDPGSFVQGTALAAVVAMIVALACPLAVLREPPFLLFMNNVQGTEIAAEMNKADQSVGSLFGLAWLVPCTILAVGFPLYRTWGEALRRIGLVTPSALQVAFAVVAAVAAVGVMNYAVEPATVKTWEHFGWRQTDAKAFEEMMKAVINPWGAVAIGLTAGLGEELFVRGVLQPRMGILLSNLLFTVMHALQYNWDALLSVFLIGMALGVIRKYSNTSTSAIVHGLYDFILIFGAYMKWFEKL